MLPVLLVLALAVLPPLTADGRTALETAHDGSDHREAAFVALVAHVRGWPADVNAPDAPEVSDPDALVRDPDAVRGAAYTVRGVLQQRTPLARPYDGAEEWFVRDDAGRALIVYVVDAPTFADGTRLAVPVRFYKRIDAVARDGTPRSYAAFVGTRPRRTGATPTGATLPVMVVLLPASVVVFLVVLIAVRRRARPRVPGVRAGAIDPDADDAPLPADPADALAELRRRADGMGD